jgi:hypothetical protein
VLSLEKIEVDTLAKVIEVGGGKATLLTNFTCFRLNQFLNRWPLPRRGGLGFSWFCRTIDHLRRLGRAHCSRPRLDGSTLAEETKQAGRQDLGDRQKLFVCRRHLLF